MQGKRPKYESYLLRLWRVGDREDAPWHAMLIHTQTGERHSFSSLALLFEFLVSELDAAGKESAD